MEDKSGSDPPQKDNNDEKSAEELKNTKQSSIQRYNELSSRIERLKKLKQKRKELTLSKNIKYVVVHGILAQLTLCFRARSVMKSTLCDMMMMSNNNLCIDGVLLESDNNCICVNLDFMLFLCFFLAPINPFIFYYSYKYEFVTIL